MKTKICSKCKKELPATTEFFHKQKTVKCDLRAQCKDCYSEYYEENRNQILEQKRRYKQSKKSKEKHKKHQKEYYKSEKGKKTQRKYQQSEKGKKARRNATNKYYKENGLSCNVSVAINKSLKGDKVGRHWETLVPYTFGRIKTTS